jgi:hypothetical protein
LEYASGVDFAANDYFGPPPGLINPVETGEWPSDCKSKLDYCGIKIRSPDRGRLAVVAVAGLSKKPWSIWQRCQPRQLCHPLAAFAIVVIILSLVSFGMIQNDLTDSNQL